MNKKYICIYTLRMKGKDENIEFFWPTKTIKKPLQVFIFSEKKRAAAVTAVPRTARLRRAAGRDAGVGRVQAASRSPRRSWSACGCPQGCLHQAGVYVFERVSTPEGRRRVILWWLVPVPALSEITES